MTRTTYTFDSSDQAAVDYEVCWQCASQRGGSTDRASSEEAERDERILTALKAIGTPQGDPPSRRADLRPYSLNLSGGTIDLIEDDWLLLMGYIKSMPYLPQMRSVAKQVRERMLLQAQKYDGAAPEKTEPSTKEPNGERKPRRLEKAG